MTIIKKWTLACCVCMVAFGCRKSFLDLSPASNANAGNFYQTKADFDLAVNAAYATLYTIYAPEGPVSYCGEQMADNATLYAISGAQSDKWQFKDYTLNVANTVVYQFWQNFYQSLYSINIVLNKIDGASLDTTYKTNVKAQMMFLRGLYYFNMVQMWGDVPLVTTPVTAEQSYAVLRSPASNVYNQILADAQYAVNNLPVASKLTSKGNASKGAAETLLGKVYLTMGNKTAATTALLDVYNSGEYNVQQTYANVFAVANKNSKESVFEIQYLGGSATNPWSPYYQSFFPNVTITFSGSGMNQVTDDLWKEYEATDIRKNLSVDTGYLTAGGSYVAQKFPKKWTDASANVVSSNKLSNNDFMVFRYADVLLLLSEATNDPQYLNLVRARAGLPLYGAAGYPSATYPTLALAIEHERRVELAMEFHRWFDLKRTSRAIPLLTAKGKAITTQRLLLPIPQTVRLQNPAITQNDGF